MKPLLRRIVARRLEGSVKRLFRNNPNLKLVAVGGSLGKTGTKLAIATVLKRQYRVLVHPGNYNTEFGLPLSLFELEAPSRVTSITAWLKILSQIKTKLKTPYPYEVAVLEVGTDHPGDIARFMRYLTPDIGVVTGIAPEHMEYFKTLDAVAEEEFTLARHSRCAILNAEFPQLVERSGKLTCAVELYGGTHMVPAFETPGLLGHPSRLAAAAAAAVARQLNVSEGYILAGLKDIKPVPGRMQLLTGAGGVTLLDDTYNAAPDSVKQALQTLQSVAKGRRIAVLGQMNELGDYTQTAHEEVGECAKDLDLLLTVGPAANRYVGPAAVKSGLASESWHKFDSPYAAGAWLVNEVKKGDTVLFKGSQNGVFTEEALKPLLADPGDAHRLVRQSADWLQRKRDQFKDAL